MSLFGRQGFCPLIFLVCVALSSFGGAMHEVISLETYSSLLEADYFFFIGGGTFSYNITMTGGAKIDFLIVDQTAIQYFIQVDESRSCRTIRDDAAASVFYYHKKLNYKEPTPRVGDVVHMTETGYYYFLFANCDKNDYGVTIDYIAKQTIEIMFLGEIDIFLGATFIPYIPIYFILVLAWLMFSISWMVNFAIFIRQSNGLHKLFSLIPPVFFVSSVCGLAYWTVCCFQGEYNVFLYVASKLMEAFSLSLLIYVIVVAAKGWRITKYWLYKYDSLTAIWCFIAVFVTYLAFSELSTFYLFIWIFELVVLLRIVFPSTVRHIAALIMMEHHLSNIGVRNIRETSARKKRQLFKRIQQVGNAYLVLLFLASIFSIFVIDTLPFIVMMVFQCLHLLFAVFLASLLYLRNFSRYNSNLDTPSGGRGKKPVRLIERPDIDGDAYERDALLVKSRLPSNPDPRSSPIADYSIATPMFSQ